MAFFPPIPLIRRNTIVKKLKKAEHYLLKLLRPFQKQALLIRRALSVLLKNWLKQV